MPRKRKSLPSYATNGMRRKQAATLACTKHLEPDHYLLLESWQWTLAHLLSLRSSVQPENAGDRLHVVPSGREGGCHTKSGKTITTRILLHQQTLQQSRLLQSQVLDTHFLWGEKKKRLRGERKKEKNLLYSHRYKRKSSVQKDAMDRGNLSLHPIKTALDSAIKRFTKMNMQNSAVKS